MDKRVYLAGPIRGLDYKSVTEWRNYAKDVLYSYGIIGVSPFRAKEHLDNGLKLYQTDNNPISSQRGITTRDRWDVKTCNILLANLLKAEEVSIGTMIEFGWADAYRKPIIAIIEKEGNIHDHPIVRDLTGFRVESLDEGIEIAKKILNY